MNQPSNSANCFECELRSVRLGEFDLGGVLYHANYLHLFEELREEFLRDARMPYPEFAARGEHLAIAEISVKYKKSVRYGEEIRGKLWVSDLKRVSFCFHYELFVGEEMVTSAKSMMVFVAADSNGALQPKAIPEMLREKLEAVLVLGG